MRLSKTELVNFRSCTNTVVEFPESLTVLIGENGGGKSNIIDSIRLSTEPASGRRSYYFDSVRDLSWIRTDEDDKLIRIKHVYDGLDELERAFYIPQLVDPDDCLRLSTYYNANDNIPRRFRRTQFVGQNNSEDPEPSNRTRIAHVYLPPLRDSVREIDSPEGNRLLEVMQLVARSDGSNDSIENFEKVGREALQALEATELAQNTREAIQQHITPLTKPVREQRVSVDARPAELRRLVRSLRIRMLEAGLDPQETTSNTAGLGYASLLYIATIIVELSRSQEFDLTILLIEEPEAHLHPQLLTVLLDYMKQQVIEINERPSKDTELTSGNIQIIASSHSPVLTSSISTANIVAVTNRQSGDYLFTRTSTVGEPIDDTPKSLEHRRRVDRFLNVTRSAMLFARQVVLVEGIAESILIKTLAEQCVFPTNRDEHEEMNEFQRKQFRAISVIGIDGIGFEPYLSVLLHDVNPIAERVVIITDADDGAGQKRKRELLSSFQRHVDTGVLHIHVGESTFESDLIACNRGNGILKDAFLELHPGSALKWDEALEAAFEPPDDLRVAGIKLQKSIVAGLRSKGEYAQAISDRLEQDFVAADFIAPAYLDAAIRSAVITPGP